MRKNPWWVDAISVGVMVALAWPELAEKRVWLWATARLAREGARRCGQVAILAETAYAREVS